MHGRFDLLSRALDEIGDLELQDARLVLLGDYVDRGPQSRDVVDELIRRTAGGRIVCGGDATLESYGGRVPADHLAWLGALP